MYNDTMPYACDEDIEKVINMQGLFLKNNLAGLLAQIVFLA